jgi:inner membrane protein involved in colicin E2 resistance
MTFAQTGLQKDITSTVQELVPNVESNNNINYVKVAKEVQRWIFMSIGIIALGYLIYIGAKLLWAPGSAEEMQSAIHSVVYVMIGLALIPFAYFLIQLIVNIRLW